MRGHYEPTTRIGNWYEESILQDEKMREFLEQKEKGTLTIQKIRQHLSTVSLSHLPQTDQIKFGTSLRLINSEFNCFLACDPGDAENEDEEIFSASGSRQADATARNVWVIQKFNDGRDFLGIPTPKGEATDILRYGDKITISSTESLGDKPFFLASCPLDWSHFSRISKKQIVFSTPKQNYSNVWSVEPINRDSLMDVEGEAVTYADSIILRHCATGAPLAANDGTFFNDYGNENELVAMRLPGKRMIWRFSTE